MAVNPITDRRGVQEDSEHVQSQVCAYPSPRLGYAHTYPPTHTSAVSSRMCHYHWTFTVTSVKYAFSALDRYFEGLPARHVHPPGKHRL